MATNSSFFELPAINSTNSWTNPDQYSFTEAPTTNPSYQPASYRDENYDIGLFVDTVSPSIENGDTGSNFWGGVWDWANTDIGASVAAGALSGIGNVWATDMASDAASDLANSKYENSFALQQSNSASQMELAQMGIAAEQEMQAAELAAKMEMQKKELEQEMAIFMKGEERIDTHNSSINKPVNMKPRNFK